MRFRFVLILLVIHGAVQANPEDSTSMYKPRIDGTIRPKYEYGTSIGADRFQVRNARFSVSGMLSKLTSYKAEIDLSDEGVTKMLDAYARIKPLPYLALTLGQQKVPFSTDNLRSPHQLYFANRSFIGKYLTGLRDVGLTARLGNEKANVALGFYNGKGLYNQKVWRPTSDKMFVGRVEWFPLGNWNISADMATFKPGPESETMYNAGTYVDLGRLHLESEIYWKTYQRRQFSPTEGFFAFAAYDFPVEHLYFTKITPLIRYDMMGENYEYDDILKDYETQVARSRITSGLTFSLNNPFINDIRLNYEKYFYSEGIENRDDKLVVEMVVRF